VNTGLLGIAGLIFLDAGYYFLFLPIQSGTSASGWFDLFAII
jgi:hypothetical protein